MTGAATSDAALFGRLLDNSRGEMSPNLARYVLTLGFNKRDQERMNELAERNQEGALAVAEREELMTNVRTGHLLAMLHAKARKSLSKKQKV